MAQTRAKKHTESRAGSWLETGESRSLSTGAVRFGATRIDLAGTPNSRSISAASWGLDACHNTPLCRPTARAAAMYDRFLKAFSAIAPHENSPLGARIHGVDLGIMPSRRRMSGVIENWGLKKLFR
jgi:hypothetical protein